MIKNVTVLRLARLFRQLSISQVSHLLKINASTISLLERNKIGATSEQKAAFVAWLGGSVSWTALTKTYPPHISPGVLQELLDRDAAVMPLGSAA